MNKCIIGGIVLALVTCGWGTMSFGEQIPAPRGELRVVDKSPLNWQYKYLCRIIFILLHGCTWLSAYKM